MEKIIIPEKYDFSKDPNGEHHPVKNLMELFRKKGLECRTVTNYDTRLKTKMASAWEYALHPSQAGRRCGDKENEKNA